LRLARAYNSLVLHKGRSLLDWNIADRDALRETVTRVLEADPRVVRVELKGSLATGNADLFSDIDFVAHLQPGLVDRDYFLELPALMDSVGPRVIDGLGFAALPNYYVGTHYFEGLPLLWHVDIDCRAASPEWHIDGAYLFQITRWEQRFKMWIEAIQRLLRAEQYGTSEYWQHSMMTSWT
jgi:predicted nucleotidyltransferase